MRYFLSGLLWVALLSWGAPSFALTLRYALIIGNNVGVDSDGTEPFPPLIHAEREATILKEKLVGLSNFDATGARTRLIKGGTVKEVRDGFRALAAQKALDEKTFKKVDSIFLLYFTGHGLSGKLLLEDAPLSSDELKQLFNAVGADFSVGVFDACYAGSLNGTLTEKGIRATPGHNIVQDLPNEVLSAKGSIWYVSSGAGQPSYEDDDLGGVFTHFFIEALSKATPDGPGITLNGIWEYARHHTTKYTSNKRRAQVPEEIVAKLRASAPIYFSFPSERTASLVLSKEMSGEFALSYADGKLTEVFRKRRGERRAFSVYPGNVRLILLDGHASALSEYDFTLGKNGTVSLHTMPEAGATPALGQGGRTLNAKGLSLDRKVSATHIQSGLSLLIGGGYAYALSKDEMLHPRHMISIPIRMDWKRWFACVSGTFGRDSKNFSAWGYTATAAGGALRLGYGYDLAKVRLNGRVGIGGAHVWQTFTDNEKKNGWYINPMVGASMVVPRRGSIYGELFVEGGPLYGSGSGLNAKESLYISGRVGFSLFFRLI